VPWSLVPRGADPLCFLSVYKGMYCCMPAEAHTAKTMIPCVIVFVGCLGLMSRCYYRAYELLKSKETGKSSSHDSYFTKCAPPSIAH
jgi:hypothetical protein